MNCTEDKHYMNLALEAANKNLGNTYPNPSVGAVIVKKGKIISVETTSKGGRPHAEENAIKKAGSEAKGATLYVTLEPCYRENSLPCCCALIKNSGISRIVIGVKDSNPDIYGKGIEDLKQAGISVTCDVCRDKAYESNIGFFYTHEKKRPFIALKIASSLDGKIATSSGESKWITNSCSRNYGHLLRANYDAILTGINSVIKDNPTLNCRAAGLKKYSPVRIILDSNLKISEHSNLIKTATEEFPVWIINNVTESSPELNKKGVLLIKSQPKNEGMISPEFVIETLNKRGITRLLIESGSKVNTSFLQKGLVDKIYWFKAPVILGEGSKPAINSLNINSLEQKLSFSLEKHMTLDTDSLEIYKINK